MTKNDFNEYERQRCEVAAELDATFRRTSKRFNVKFWNRSLSAKSIRNGVDLRLIKQTWLRANNAGEFHISNPSLFRRLKTEIFCGSHSRGKDPFWESLFSEAEMSERDQLERTVTEHFQKISECPFTHDLISALMIFLTAEEAFSVITCIADKVKEVGGRTYLTRSHEFWEWSVYQLTRFVKEPSVEDLFVFEKFVSRGGASVLTHAQFLRLVGCFLFEGCKVFTRVGIAWLLLRGKGASTDELFKKAFGLSISIRSFPLSEKRRKKLPGSLNDTVRTLTVFPERIDAFESSRLFKLEGYLEKTLSTLQVGNVSITRKIFDSSLDGTSGRVLESRFNQHADFPARFVIFQALDGMIIFAVAEHLGLSEFSGTTQTVSSKDGFRMRRTQGHCVLEASEGNVLCMVNEAVDVISVPSLSLDSVRIFDFEILICK